MFKLRIVCADGFCGPRGWNVKLLVFVGGIVGFEADPATKLPAGLCDGEGNSAEGTENGGRCPIWGDGMVAVIGRFVCIPVAWGVDGPEGKDAYPSTFAVAEFAGAAPERLTPCGGAARGPKGGASERAICPMLFGPRDAELPIVGPEKPVETVLGANGRSGSDPGGMLLGTS